MRVSLAISIWDGCTWDDGTPADTGTQGTDLRLLVVLELYFVGAFEGAKKVDAPVLWRWLNSSRMSMLLPDDGYVLAVHRGIGVKVAAS